MGREGRKKEGGRECKRESEGGGRGAMTVEGDAAQGRKDINMNRTEEIIRPDR